MTANDGTTLVARPHQLKLGGILGGGRHAHPHRSEARQPAP